jgi:hypothetical protein
MSHAKQKENDHVSAAPILGMGSTRMYCSEMHPAESVVKNNVTEDSLIRILQVQLERVELSPEAQQRRIETSLFSGLQVFVGRIKT